MSTKLGLCESRDVYYFKLFSQGLINTTLQIRCVKLCKVVYYMNHTTGLCGSYSTQLYTALHNVLGMKDDVTD